MSTKTESWLDVTNEYWKKRERFGIPVDYEMTEEEEESFYISDEAIQEWAGKKQFSN